MAAEKNCAASCGTYDYRGMKTDELHAFLVKHFSENVNLSADGHAFTWREKYLLDAVICCANRSDFTSKLSKEQQLTTVKIIGFLTTSLRANGKIFVKNRFNRRFSKNPGLAAAIGSHLNALCDSQQGYAPLNALGLVGAIIGVSSSNFEVTAKLLVDSFISQSDFVPSASMAECLCSFMSKLPGDVFELTVLPAIERSLLRNPEVVIGYLSKMICATKFPTKSALAKRLCSACGTHVFCSTDPKRAGYGKAIFDHLQKHCESAESADVVGGYLLSALSNELSDVKLVAAEQRIRCMAMLSSYASGPHSADLSIRILNALKPLIKSEANEAIAVEMVVCFTKWLVSMHEPLSPEKVSFIKAIHSAKTSGPLLRAALLNCVVQTEDNAAMSTSFVDVITQSFTKTKGQIGQVSSAAELFVAANAALRLIVFDSKLEVKLKPVWEHLLDSAVLHQLVNDKFYASLAPWAITCVLKTVESMLVRFPNRIEHCVEQFSRPIAIGFCHADKEIRDLTFSLMERILERSSFAYSVSKFCFDAFPAIVTSSSKSTTDTASGTATATTHSIIRKHGNHSQIKDLCLLLRKYLSTVFADTESRLCIALSLLRLACTPEMCSFLLPETLFHRFIYSFLENPDEFLKENIGSLLKSVYTHFAPLEVECSALLVLLTNSATTSVSHVVSLLVSIFSNQSFSQVTKEDVDIMNTAAGVVCDKAALEVILSSDERAGNMKRESKAYSYKDQLADMELRKELIAKSRSDLQKLAPAQQAKVDALLKRESEIRDRLKAALAKFQKEASVAKFLFSHKKTGSLMRTHAWHFVSTLTPLFRSPLVGSQANKLFISISRCVFSEPAQQSLATCISAAYLRAFDSCVDLGKPWATYTANEHYTKVVQLISGEHMDAAQFSFAFPLANYLARQRNVLSRDDLSGLINVLHERFTSYDPKTTASFLPRKEFLDLIVFVVDQGFCEEEVASTILCDLCRTNFVVDDGRYFDEDLAEQLIKMLLHTSPLCRRVVLRAFNEFGDFISNVHPELSVEFLGSILIISYDPDDGARELASNVWAKACESPAIMPEFVRPALREVQCARSTEIREACASALAAIVTACPMLVNSVITELFAVYRKCYPAVAKKDDFGRPIIPSQAAQQQMFEYQGVRLSVAACLDKLAPIIPLNTLKDVFTFLIPTPLADPTEAVRERMLTAATALLAVQGPDVVDIVLPITENFLRTAPPDDASLDPARQASVVLTATVARHLAKDDPRVRQVMQKLTETLSTPSEPVQIAVANSMAPLVRSIAKDELPAVVENLMKVLFEGESFAERRGAAYGLASIVKGHGVVALKQFELTSQLEAAIENKKEAKRREGALFAHEIMCRILGPIFEPHIIAFLPNLLTSFGDTQTSVRLAADDCAKEIMSKLTSHGVKLVLPMLLEGLRSEQWRTKCASSELLGAMAYCAPRQLSACLPTIVPRLMETVNDSHSKVQKGGENALRQIQSVIKNPEIQGISSVVIDALLNPLEKSSICLKTLTGTRLVHRLDAPSLALIMPVIQRALSERQTEPRRLANQLISSVNAQTNPSDFEPYIPSLLPGVKQSLLDPAPDVRLVASKALGALGTCLGETVQSELLPWLLEMLISETSSANRSGAAQGLCEVVHAMGTAKLEQLVREAVSVSKRPEISAATRDGYLMLFVFLPPVFGDDFAPHVVTVIPAILRGLSDESEVVRETALRAGQRIIQLYSKKAQELFVPELEKGLIHDNWRIRYSSVILLGEFLFKVADITGKMTTETADDDDTFGTDRSHEKISEIIGKDMSDRVLAGLYLGRQDVALVCRQATLHIWKLIVPNTPRILREIAPVLLETIIVTFASRNAEKIQIAQRTLGDVVRKLGDRMLNEVIHFFDKTLVNNKSLDDEDVQREMKREAVCLAISEVIANANKDQLQIFFKSLASPIKRALLDPSASVRALAAKAFSSLHSVVTTQAITEIVTPLCDPTTLGEGETDYALDSLAQIMSLKSRTVLPTLLPHLLHPKPNTKALAMISEVAGEAIGRSIGIIIPALLDAVSATRASTPADLPTCLEECQVVMLSVDDEEVSRQILTSLLGACTPDNEARCLSALSLLSVFLEETDLEVTDHALAILKALLLLCRSSNVTLLDQVWACLDMLVSKRLEQEDYLSNMNYLRQIVHTTIGNSKPPLPGFVLSKKAVAPILPMYRDCLLSGTPEVKELAACGLEEVVNYSSPEVLKTQVINITGPLIRVLGDRFGPNVKTAILGALDALLKCCGPLLKPFIPQLQTTFNKCLVDTQRAIRQRCSAAYGGLAAIHMRPESLLTDLTNLVRSNAAEPGVRDSILVAIRKCLLCLTDGRCPEAGANVLCDCLFQTFSCIPDITTRQAAAGCVGTVMIAASDAVTETIIKSKLISMDPYSPEWVQVHFRVISLQPLLIADPGKLERFGLLSKVSDFAKKCMQSNQALLTASAARLCLLILKYQITVSKGAQVDNEIVSALVGVLKQGSLEVREVIAGMLFQYGVEMLANKEKHPQNPKFVSDLVPQLAMGTKEKQASLRRACELALVELLRLRSSTEGTEMFNAVVECLDSGMRETLRELHIRVLKKLAEQPRPNLTVQDDETLIE